MARVMLADVSDEALLVRYANGVPDAARLLMQRLLPRVLSDAAPMVSDRTKAEVVAQESMLRLWKIAPDWRQQREALQAALDTVPDRQRQAVVLRHIDGWGNPETALVMEIGVEAVESLTARGKRSLAAALSGQRAMRGHGEGDEAP